MNFLWAPSVYGMLWSLLAFIWTQVARRTKRDLREPDSWASPGAWWGRLFSLTKDVRSDGWGKSCWSEFKSASMSCRAAHFWLVEEASFSSSVAWSSCWWREEGSSAGVGSCNTTVVYSDRNTGGQMSERCTNRENYVHTWDESDIGDFFGDLFTLKVLLRKNINSDSSGSRITRRLLCETLY